MTRKHLIEPLQAKMTTSGFYKIDSTQDKSELLSVKMTKQIHPAVYRSVNMHHAADKQHTRVVRSKPVADNFLHFSLCVLKSLTCGSVSWTNKLLLMRWTCEVNQDLFRFKILWKLLNLTPVFCSSCLQRKPSTQMALCFLTRRPSTPWACTPTLWTPAWATSCPPASTPTTTC